MKILAIGNSFSEDATAYLKKIADSAGKDLTVVNLYIGGCSIEMHAENIREDRQAYQYQHNGIFTKRMISIREALTEEPWDVVTVQQASHDSGIYESYEQGGFLIQYIQAHCPTAKIWFHKTWSYEVGGTHPCFVRYDSNQEKMDCAITETVDRFCRENGNLPQLPVGDVIRALRKEALFDTANQGQSLYRDGFHMHLIYGRYAAAATWYQTLVGELKNTDFYPQHQDVINGYEAQLPADFETDLAMIAQIREAVYNVCTR